MKPGLLVVALLAAGCTSTAPPPPPVHTVIPSAVVPSSGVRVTDLSGADPCGLLDPRALSRIGAASVDIDIEFTECEASIALSSGGRARASVAFEFTPPASTPTTPNLREGVKVYGGPGQDHACWRYIVVSDHETIRATGSMTDDPELRCAIADAVVDGMLPLLTSGSPPRSDLPEDSLGRHDACRLLDVAQVRAVASIDVREVHPTYGGQSCTWTAEDPGPVVLVTFSRTYPPTIPGHGDREVRVAGRTGVMAVRVGVGSGRDRRPPGCEVKLVHRPLDGHPKKVEVLSVLVSAERPGEDSCGPVADLAEAALNRLRRG